MEIGIEDVLKDYFNGDSTPMCIWVGMAGLRALSALKIPQTAADLMTGTLSFSGGDIMTIGGSEATAIAGGATSLAGSAANSAGRALKARRATPDQDSATEAPQAPLTWQPAPQARWEQLGLAK